MAEKVDVDELLVRLSQKDTHIQETARLLKEKDDLLEYAWGIIANAGAGDWDRERPDWKEAAKKWRSDYFKQCTPATRPLAP